MSTETTHQTAHAVRLDKWLWAARFFKTRGLAADACDLGRIECRGQRLKPSRILHVGDPLRIVSEAGEFHVEVLQVSEVRGPAAVAQTLYRETDASRAARAQAAEERKQMLATGGLLEGRPSKQDRRAINKLRGRIHRF